MFNADVASDNASDYRVAPALAVRLVGLTLATVGVLVFVATLLVAVAGYGAALLLVVALVGVVGAGALAWWLGTRARVVHLDELGYRVRFVRGAGVPRRGGQTCRRVERHAVAGSDCMVLRLRDGRTTTIPLEVVAGGPDAPDSPQDVATRRLGALALAAAGQIRFVEPLGRAPSSLSPLLGATRRRRLVRFMAPAC